MGWGGSFGAARGATKSSKKEKQEITRLLIDRGIDSKPNLNDEYELVLEKSKDNHREFMKECSDFRLPNIRKLKLVSGREKFDDNEDQYIGEFLEKSTPSKLQYFVITTGQAPTYPQIDRLFMKLCNALTGVTDEVYINGLALNSNQLVKLIESCKNTKRLALVNCNIKLSSPIKIYDDGSEYNLEHLDLFSSYYPKDKEYMNDKGVMELAKAMGATSIKNKLKSVHISSYISKGQHLEEQKIFNDQGFTAQVIADNQWPRPQGENTAQTNHKMW